MIEEQTEIPQEKKGMQEFFSLSAEEQKKQLRTLSLLLAVFEGKNIDEQQDLISFNVNLKDIKERTRFVTFPILKENVYFRLLADLYPEIAASGLLYADMTAKSYISYKGLGREEFRDIRKAAQPEIGQDLVIGNYSQNRPETPPKRRFWQKRPKTEHSDVGGD